MSAVQTVEERRECRGMHLVTEAYRLTRKGAAPGVDGVTGRAYGENPEANLKNLHDGLRTLKYRAVFPSNGARRGWIPKEGGKRRPTALPVFEDKLVERAVVMLLEQVYEREFYDFSYGFRPGKSAHKALKALRLRCTANRVGWIVEADIRGFFDNPDRGVLRELLHRRVKDGGTDRLIGKWFHAGVLEGGELSHPEKGTPQGGVVSPMLANIYLHYVLDEWFAEVVRPRLKGRSFLVRYADDFAIGCEREDDARRVMEVLPKRMARYGLEIHSEKTRLVPFARPSSDGDGKDGGDTTGTFDFLGFTHYWAKSRRGNWVMKRKTEARRLRRAVRAVYDWCRTHRHKPLVEQCAVLASKLRGHYQYYGLRCNYRSLKRLYDHAVCAWRKWLGTRSQKSYIPWPQFRRLLAVLPLPRPRIVHGFG